jgi:hypothetical protein
MADVTTPDLTTGLAVEAVAWGRAPRHPGDRINRRIVCADGFKVSAQASSWHYAKDSHASGEAPYWRGLDTEPTYPFVSFEIGNPSSDPEPAEVWDEFEAGGVWAWVPRQAVADLLGAHGGAVAWEESGE